jgi:hypothetical protein
LDEAGLADAGFAGDLTVTSLNDTTPPRLASFEITPTTIDASGGADIIVSLGMIDDLAGVTNFQVALADPFGHVMEHASATFAPKLSGTLSGKIHLAPQSQAGTWTVASVFLMDAAGNTSLFSAEDLASRGLPYRVTVANPSAREH